jgi:ABC-type microcin C transport system duplicated ATPase subunit YejF
MHSTMVNAIEVSHLRRTFTSHIGVIRRTSKEIGAVDDVSFEIQEFVLHRGQCTADRGSQRHLWHEHVHWW